ncbi:MAG: hypothetical protein FJW37_15405 [Acidobacteria bacterium]|nr:hypothetical protein [Acidobacteriota bacterium]
MACAICETRRPKRFCPGVRGDICAPCCGESREVTVDCPLDCPYLVDAHKFERIEPVNPDLFPNRDIRVSEQFIRDQGLLLEFTARLLLRSALETPGAVDSDVRETLQALIRTYRTLQSGLYYETRPSNPLADRIFSALQEGLADFRQQESQRGLTRTRDADVLGVLAFLERLELDRDNGRRRGRAFLGFLREHLPDQPAAREASPLLPPS